MNSCTHLNSLLKEEKEALVKAIDDDKYFLSEKSGYDVGFSEAKKDFINNYLCSWAKEFKKEYCRHCPDYNVCEIKEI